MGDFHKSDQHAGQPCPLCHTSCLTALVPHMGMGMRQQAWLPIVRKQLQASCAWPHRLGAPHAWPQRLGVHNSRECPVANGISYRLPQWAGDTLSAWHAHVGRCMDRCRCAPRPCRPQVARGLAVSAAPWPSPAALPSLPVHPGRRGCAKALPRPAALPSLPVHPPPGPSLQPCPPCLSTPCPEAGLSTSPRGSLPQQNGLPAPRPPAS